MRYYVGAIVCDSNYLEHHGVKGQKWGVRKYQNADGSLTEEGRQHYGYGDEAERIAHNPVPENGSLYMRRRGRALSKALNRREAKEVQRFSELEDARASGDQKAISKAEKRYEKAYKKSNAQHKANIDHEEYMHSQGKGKRIAKTLLMSGPGSMFNLSYFDARRRYDHARARGSGRVRSLFETSGGILGQTLRIIGDKKAYGAVTHSGL